jgi:hypothetical protein
MSSNYHILELYLFVSECSADIALSPLPEYISCYISDVCTSVQCCLEVDIIQTSVEFSLTIDACNNILHIGIENMVIEKELGCYEYGEYCFQLYFSEVL